MGMIKKKVAISDFWSTLKYIEEEFYWSFYIYLIRDISLCNCV